jgi:hypothetical protein
MAEKKERIHTPKEGKREEGTSRRNFLKKAASAAPTLMVLGQLGKPKKAAAGDPFGGPPSDPGS